MSQKLKGKVAIVTGAGSGMGRSGADLFAKHGARVVLAEINEQSGLARQAAIREAGGDATYVHVDVRLTESVQELVKQTVQLYGGVDILYHNAVNVPFVNKNDRRLTELPEETWHEMIRLVLDGTFYCCKYVGLEMLKAGRGSIILTATVDALIGTAGLDAYTAAKGGVVSVTRSFAAGMGKQGVRVNAVCPGFVTTEPQMEWFNAPGSSETMDMLHLTPVATPEEIAPFVLFLASDESRPMTGGIYPIDSGYTAFKANVDLMDTLSHDEKPKA